MLEEKTRAHTRMLLKSIKDSMISSLPGLWVFFVILFYKLFFIVSFKSKSKIT